MNVQDFLEEMQSGVTHADFIAAYPHHVLVEVEGEPGSHGPPAEGMTERLNPEAVRRQAMASRHAQVYELRPRADEPTITVGRTAQCDVCVDHKSISKEHARFLLTDEGLLLEDLGSTNGTLLNGRRLDAQVPTAVSPDDAICFGRATAFHLMDAEGLFQYLGLLQRFGL